MMSDPPIVRTQRLMAVQYLPKEPHAVETFGPSGLVAPRLNSSGDARSRVFDLVSLLAFLEIQEQANLGIAHA